MRRALYLALLACSAFTAAAQREPGNQSGPGSRTVMDAHNCYPYYEWWYNRIDRALSAGTPLAIEQDLYWYTDARTGKSWSIVAHDAPISGHEPTMEHYFFDRVRTIVERALKEGNKGDWPLITLNLDFKTEEPAHLQAVWTLLAKYQDWLTTAPKTSDPVKVRALKVRPILVLTGESDARQKVFFDLQKIVQRSRRIPALLDGQLAARRARPVDGQQRRYPRPGHIGLFTIGVFFKETIQFKPLPQFQSKETGAERTCPLQTHFVQQYPRHLRIVVGRRHHRREQFQLPRIALLVENFNRLHPARLRRTVQFTQIAERSLTRTIRRARRFHQRPVRVRLAVLAATVRTQIHAARIVP